MSDGDFNLKRFMRELGITRPERAIVQDCLTRGVERYHLHLYGLEHAERRPAFLMLDRLDEPFVFGFAAVEVVREPALSLETRLKVVEYAFQRMRPLEAYGTPHGLPALVSFLVTVGGLDMQLLRSALKLVDIEQRLFEDWTFEEARVLVDWLISTADLPQSERLWWLWYIVAHCEQAELGRGLVEHLVAHPVLDTPLKRDVFQGLLAGRAAGTPPEAWITFDAALAGDVEALERTLDSAEGAEAEGLLAPEDDERRSLEDFVPSPGLFQQMMAAQFEAAGLIMVPTYLKRQAVVALAHLGDDTLGLCHRYLGANRGYYADAVNQGVADVIREYAGWMSSDQVRELVERGLTIPKVNTRKAFYQLGVDLFGTEYWERALKDNAGSVRQWAARQANRKAQQAIAKQKRGTRSGRHLPN